ncbi:MAG: hypothetical protein KC423_07700 [Anaerolineales bacterium]|nr:hypothetical protein [Anaerolineales bacterium]
MEKYENKLVEEWQRFSLAYKDELDSDATEADLRKCGRAILNHMGSINIPIRERVTEEYVMRGNYHILADNLKGALPRVIWHPKFLERVLAIFQ